MPIGGSLTINGAVHKKTIGNFLSENLTMVLYNGIMSTKGECSVGGQVRESEGCSSSHHVQSSTSEVQQ